MSHAARNPCPTLQISHGTHAELESLGIEFSGHVVQVLVPPMLIELAPQSSQSVSLLLAMQSATKPCPTLQMLHGIEEDERTGQKLFGRQFDRSAGVEQNDPASQSVSLMDRAGQYEPEIHCILMASCGQKKPAGQSPRELEPWAQ